VTLHQSIRPVALTHQISTTAFLHQKENNPGNPSALQPIFFCKNKKEKWFAGIIIHLKFDEIQIRSE
jgi:hypothetical protein